MAEHSPKILASEEKANVISLLFQVSLIIDIMPYHCETQNKKSQVKVRLTVQDSIQLTANTTKSRYQQ